MYKNVAEFEAAKAKTDAFFSTHPETEEFYQAFRYRVMCEVWEMMQPELKRLHDLGIAAFNS